MNKMFAINDISGQNSECCTYANKFLPYAHKKLGFNKPVDINFISDPENAKDPLGKTAYYDPSKMEITIFVDKRHVKDILRSLSHELVHHSQNCRGEFDSGGTTEPGYAQKNPHMRKMEAEAYLLGNGFLFRDWEDQLKQKKEKMTMSEGKIEEEELEEQTKTNRPDRVTGREPARRTDEVAGADGEGDIVEEGEGDGCPPCPKCGATHSKKQKKPAVKIPASGGGGARETQRGQAGHMSENWTRENKDQLLFERLVKKWIK